MVDKLNMHYSMQNVASIYDEEALTALELAGRTTAKVNECVEQVNAIPEKVAADVQAHIEGGDFDKQIDVYAGKVAEGFQKEMDAFQTTTEKRIDNLLGGVTEGTSTFDAEIIDARLGENGTTYQNLGQAIRTQMGRTLALQNTPEPNADLCTKTGLYFVSASEGWENLPLYSSGMITTVNGNTPHRLYQTYQTYENEMYWRCLKNGVFSEWVKVPDYKNTLMRFPTGYSDNVDDIKQPGMYPFGSSTDHNAPEEAGMLVVFANDINTQYYQMFIGYFGGMYYRGFSGGQYGVWKRVGLVTEPVDVKVDYTKEYTLVRDTDTNVYIYKRGSKGFVRYQYFRHTDESINMDTWRMGTIEICDENRYPIRDICAIGADVEGVVLLNGESDHIGGVHGDETLDDYRLFVDGREFRFEEITSLSADNVTIIVNSKMYHAGGGAHCINHYKHVVFDRTGVAITNRWTALEQLNVTSVRGGMLSVEKDCFTHYYDSAVNLNPVPYGTEAGVLSTDANIKDFFFVGDIYAKVEPLNRGGSHHGTLIQDYGNRIKAYFTCHNGETAAVGFSLKGGGKFYITY